MPSAGARHRPHADRQRPHRHRLADEFRAITFRFAGNRYAPPTDMAGVTMDTLSELADIKIDALIGCDILAGLHAMHIRWNEGILEFADDFPDGETVDKMETLGGIPAQQ
jgi:hypothetical protein